MRPDSTLSIPTNLFTDVLEDQPFLVEVASMRQRLPRTVVETNCPFCQIKFTDFVVAREHLMRSHFCDGCFQFHHHYSSAVQHSQVFEYIPPPYPCTACHELFPTVFELQRHAVRHFMRMPTKCTFSEDCDFFAYTPAECQHHVWLHELDKWEKQASIRRMASRAKRQEGLRQCLLQLAKENEEDSNVPFSVEKKSTSPLQVDDTTGIENDSQSIENMRTDINIPINDNLRIEVSSRMNDNAEMDYYSQDESGM
ncbi:uncharacterized protein LOC108672975 [Hyalella azteca]|uniref:Uncharacterized protein LOC108672975 n=1 Tax=Hyalella azteca TaxID=294128 RepID=A0A8B7NRA8_HYAAZ|nr:uncharacterized protein LOC108672975 [Hyalella azteca]